MGAIEAHVLSIREAAEVIADSFSDLALAIRGLEELS